MKPLAGCTRFLPPTDTAAVVAPKTRNQLLCWWIIYGYYPLVSYYQVTAFGCEVVTTTVLGALPGRRLFPDKTSINSEQKNA